MEIYELIFVQLISKFEEIRDTLKKGIDQLGDDELNYRPNYESNTIANLVVHIEGNIYQRIGTGIHGHQDIRARDNEFSRELYVSKEELINRIDKSFKLLIESIKDLENEDLLRTIEVRGKAKTIYEILQQCASHYSEHLGQILYLTKLCLGSSYNTTSIYKKHFK
ncbi:DinB family protein [Paenibacillus sp. F6_3S_P_1C]|uniref:DinB family protein n=1 Tax=Paenibacillus vandeheii TaxID=3035917 RepID=A0ABT8J6A5_9BACL|nr:DinB family protein [Paenibacillus vandeheii]MDN4600618.1 DinB family protein [Paenibacillus vandeheii]